MVRLFRHYVPQSLMWLGAAELLVLICACYIALYLTLENYSLDPTQTNSHLQSLDALVFIGVMLFSLFSTGLYQLRIAGNLRSTMIRLFISLLIAAALTGGILAATPSNWATPGIAGICLATALFGLVGTRLVFYSIVDTRALQHQILVIGTGRRAAQLTAEIHESRIRGVNICGFVPVNSEKTQTVSGNDVIVPDRDIHSLVAELGVDEIIIALDERRGALPAEEILECKMNGTKVTELLDFIERHTGAINLDSLHPSSLIFCDGFSRAAMGNWRKRTFDLLVSTLLLIIALPVMVITMLAIWLECGGRESVFYRQVRVGKHGRPFEVLKFRSMCPEAEKEGAQWATANDHRVTRVGRFIRQTRIDELPQLFNVFRGEMSFVGPRPERPEFVDNLKAVIPFYDIRHQTLPGITGWAQVCYPYGASVDDARRKLQYDLYYMKNHSLFLDLTILFQTIQVCLWRQGAR